MLVDGRPASACLTYAVQAEGREITTLHGFADPTEELHPLQHCFLERGGSQCGFCTPGMMLTAAALAERTPDADRDDIRYELVGNLCRCTGYTAIVDSVEAWVRDGAPDTSAETDRAGPGMSEPTTRRPGKGKRVKTDRREEFNVVGTSPGHHDFVDKVRGTLLYAADWKLPGMVFGKVVRSEVAAGRIVEIDVEEAQGLDGVVAVLTAADVPHNAVVEHASGGLGEVTVEQPVLATDRVRYVGEPIAVVAAVDQETADEAADLIRIEYEQLAGVYSPDEALADGAPLVHDAGNVLVNWQLERGDLDKAFANADVVVEDVYRTQHVEHAYLETEAGVVLDRERRGHPPGLDPGDRARDGGRRHPRASREPGACHRVVHGWWFRRQGGHDRRALPRPAGLAHPPARADGVDPSGVDPGQHQTSSVHDALPHRRRQRRTHRRHGGRHRRRRGGLSVPERASAVRRRRTVDGAVQGAGAARAVPRCVHQQRPHQRLPRLRSHASGPWLRVAARRARRCGRHEPDGRSGTSTTSRRAMSSPRASRSPRRLR